MIKFIAWLYINTIRKWISNILRKKYNKQVTEQDKIELVRLKLEVNDLNDVHNELKRFKWVSDPIGGAIDWSPDIKSFLVKNKKDDCDGAAYYTNWLLELIGIDSKVISLVSKKPPLIHSHVICIANIRNKYKLFSNGKMYLPDFDSFEQAVDWYIRYTKNQGTEYFKWYIEINY